MPKAKAGNISDYLAMCGGGGMASGGPVALAQSPAQNNLSALQKIDPRILKAALMRR